MATKTRVDPVTLELAQRWTGFVNKYTPYGLSNVHDEASWNKWVQMMKDVHKIIISNKYYTQYRPAFEAAGGADDLAALAGREHNTSTHTSGGSHGAAHPPVSAQTEKVIETLENAVKLPFSGTSQSASARAIQPGTQSDTTQPSQAEPAVSETPEETKQGEANNTAEQVTQQTPVSANVSQNDNPPSTGSPSQASGAPSPSLLQQLENDQIARMRKDERYQEMSKKLEEEVRERFQQRRQQLLTARTVEEEADKKWYEERLDKNSPTYEQGVQRNTARFEKNMSDYQRPVWRSVAQFKNPDGTTDTHEEYVSPLDAWTQNSLETDYHTSKGNRGILWRNKERYVQRDATGTIIKTYGDAEAGPDLRPFSPYDKQIQQAFIKSYGEEYGYSQRGNEMVFTGLNITPVSDIEIAESEQDTDESESEEVTNPVPFMIPHITPPSIHPSLPSQDESEAEQPSRDIGRSYTRDERQEQANQPSAPNQQPNRRQQPNLPGGNKLTKGAKKLGNGLKKGAEKAGKAASDFMKQGLKRLAKEGIKQAAEQVAAATAPYWGTAVIVILILLLLLIIIIALFAGNQTNEEQTQSAIPLTLTKTVDKTEIKNPSELKGTEGDLTYSLNATYPGKAQYMQITELLPDNSVFATASGNYKTYDKEGNEITNPSQQTSAVRKVVWSNQPTATQTSQSTSSQTPNVTSCGSVVQIGDSLTVGTHDAGIENKYKAAGWTPVIPGDPTKKVAGDFCTGADAGYPCHAVSGGNSPTGLEAVDINKESIQAASAVVVELGTNRLEGNDDSSFKTAATQMITKIKGLNPNAKLYWVNLASPINVAAYATRNQVIADVAASQNVTVIDWFHTVYPSGTPAQGNPLIADDDVHPTGAGYTKLADLIVSSVGNMGTACNGGTSNSGVKQILPLQVQLVLRPDPAIHDTYIINQASAQVFGADASSTTTTGTIPPGGDEPPNTNDCNGTYTKELAKNPLHQNFGDPSCTLTEVKQRDNLYALLKQKDPTNADKWFFNVIPCESVYDPNAWADPSVVGTPDPVGAWGLFQMGRGRAGQYDHGDVAWQQQVSNAVTYNNALAAKGIAFHYWECAKSFWQ